MLIDKYLLEEEVDMPVTTDDIDKMPDVNDPEDDPVFAQQIEDAMKECAYRNMDYFSENSDSLKSFMESDTMGAMLEARKFSKRTYVRLGKEDDLTRRIHMGCLILGRENNHPEFKKMMFHRRAMKKAKKKLIKLYTPRATRLAKLSQKQHIKDMRSMPALPKIKTN